MTIKQESVSLEDAQRVIAAGQVKAAEIGSPSNVAVVDAGGNLVSHIRMDHAWVTDAELGMIDAAFPLGAPAARTSHDLGPGRLPWSSRRYHRNKERKDA